MGANAERMSSQLNCSRKKNRFTQRKKNGIMKLAGLDLVFDRKACTYIWELVTDITDSAE